MSERHISVDPKVVQTIYLARMENRLKKLHNDILEIRLRLEAIEARGLPFNPQKIYQYKTVNAGEKATVYEYEIPSGYVGFIRYVGCSWYPNTFYEWYIDDLVKEKVERVIGDPSGPTSMPLRLSKPLVVYDKIEWVVKNNDSVPHVFEVLNDGEIYPKSIARRIGGIEY